MGKRIGKAFLTGGAVGVIGQLLILAAGMLVPDETVALMLGMLLFGFVGVGLIVTGVYLKIAKFGDTGASIPLSGLMFGAAMGTAQARKEGMTPGKAVLKGFAGVLLIVAIGYAIALVIGLF